MLFLHNQIVLTTSLNSLIVVVMVGDIHAIKKGNSDAPSVTNVNINGTEYYYDCDYLENSTYVLS